MADEDDIAHVMSGASDLAGCVLDGADFSKAALSSRDFSKAKLAETNFARADVSGSNFERANLVRTNFNASIMRGVRLNGAVFQVDFSSADLTSSVLHGNYARCDFSGAILSGANFNGAVIDGDCKFDSAIVDAATSFDRVEIPRASARARVFEGYRYERGMLRKMAPVSDGGVDNKKYSDAIGAITEALLKLEGINQSPGIGHNYPPDEFTLTSEEVAEGKRALLEARSGLERGIVDPETIESVVKVSRSLQEKALNWVAGHSNTAVSEFAKAAGQTLGSKTALISGALYFSDTFGWVVNHLSKLVGG